MGAGYHVSVMKNSITWNKTSNWYDDSRAAVGVLSDGREVTVWQRRGLVVRKGGGTSKARSHVYSFSVRIDGSSVDLNVSNLRAAKAAALELAQ